jgi:hypothetical protein
MATAMGVRNAAMRKLAVPDLTTTVLTLTVAGLAADSSFAGGTNPRWTRRAIAVVSMLGGAWLGAWSLRFGLATALALALAVDAASAALLLRRSTP